MYLIITFCCFQNGEFTLKDVKSVTKSNWDGNCAPSENHLYVLYYGIFFIMMVDTGASVLGNMHVTVI